MPHLGERPLRVQQYGSATNLNARAALHQRFSTNPYGWQRWVLDRLVQTDAADVLEVGCGAGGLWQANYDRVSATWRVTLSDFSVGMLQDARRVLTPACTTFRYAVCDARRLPFSDASVDCLIANHMLYHVPDRPTALREAARALRPGGRFIATTNGERHLAELDELARRHGLAMDALSSAPFTLENGAEQLLRVFADVSCERYDDSLHVTETEPLVAYVLSTFDPADVDATVLANLRADIDTAIRRDGFITIRKEAGLFCAR